MLNRQSRELPVPAPRAAAALRDLVALWPAPPWPALKLDRGLAVGSRGGHGPIRYSVSVCEAGRIRFVFEPRIGLVGYHELHVEPADDGRCRIVDTLARRAGGRMRLLWPVMFRWLHEDLMHTSSTTSSVPSPAAPRLRGHATACGPAPSSPGQGRDNATKGPRPQPEPSAREPIAP